MYQAHETIDTLIDESHISSNKIFLSGVPIKNFHNLCLLKKNHNFVPQKKRTISPPQKTIIYLLIIFLKNKIKLRIEFDWHLL